MRRLDDIRGSNQSIRPKRQPVKQLKRRQQIKRPARIIHAYKSLNFFKLFKWPIFFFWRQKIIVIATVLIIIIGAMATLVIKTKIIETKETQNLKQELSKAEQLKQVVIKEDTKLVIDFTFNLKMIINNQPQAIPAGYGKVEDEKFIFNTDTSSGDIRVQSPKKEAYALRDFFALWGGQFNSSCLLNHCLGGGSGSLTMTVNDKINSEFDGYVIKEGDQIVITYNDQ